MSFSLLPGKVVDLEESVGRVGSSPCRGGASVVASSSPSADDPLSPTAENVRLAAKRASARAGGGLSSGSPYDLSDSPSPENVSPSMGRHMFATIPGQAGSTVHVHTVMESPPPLAHAHQREGRRVFSSASATATDGLTFGSSMPGHRAAPSKVPAYVEAFLPPPPLFIGGDTGESWVLLNKTLEELSYADVRSLQDNFMAMDLTADDGDIDLTYGQADADSGDDRERPIDYFEDLNLTANYSLLNAFVSSRSPIEAAGAVNPTTSPTTAKSVGVAPSMWSSQETRMDTAPSGAPASRGDNPLNGYLATSSPSSVSADDDGYSRSNPRRPQPNVRPQDAAHGISANYSLAKENARSLPGSAPPPPLPSTTFSYAGYGASRRPTPSPAASAFSSTSPSPAPGASASAPSLQLENFDVGRLIGRGRYGAVHYARERQSGMAVALKVISRQVIRSHGLASSLRREVELQTLACGMASSIVELYATFTDDENFYMVFDYADGGSFADLLEMPPNATVTASRGDGAPQEASRRGLPEGEVAEAVRDLAVALDALHAHGMVHRDVRPANAMRKRDAAARRVMTRLTGFSSAVSLPGLPGSTAAETAGRASSREGVCSVAAGGTPDYQAPEQISGRPFGAAADLWSLGMCAYELLCGRLPFAHMGVEAMNRRILTGDIPLPAWISPQAVSFLQALLCTDETQRLTARMALRHPFLAGASSTGHGEGTAPRTPSRAFPLFSHSPTSAARTPASFVTDGFLSLQSVDASTVGASGEGARLLRASPPPSVFHNGLFTFVSSENGDAGHSPVMNSLTAAPASRHADPAASTTGGPTYANGTSIVSDDSRAGRRSTTTAMCSEVSVSTMSSPCDPLASMNLDAVEVGGSSRRDPSPAGRGVSDDTLNISSLTAVTESMDSSVSEHHTPRTSASAVSQSHAASSDGASTTSREETPPRGFGPASTRIVAHKGSCVQRLSFDDDGDDSGDSSGAVGSGAGKRVEAGARSLHLDTHKEPAARTPSVSIVATKKKKNEETLPSVAPEQLTMRETFPDLLNLRPEW